jgi:hypothetical protein
MPKRNSRRIRKLREDPVSKLAREIGLPPEQHHGLKAVDIANHSEDDQREMVRLRAAEPDRDMPGRKSDKARQTVRKLTRVELLTRAGIITPDQALACEWYGERYQLAFDYGQGTCANYGGVGGSGGLGWDHGARSLAQGEARKDLEYARLALPDWLLGEFERVVIGPMDIRTLTKEGRSRFSLAAFRLHGQIGHLLAMAA